MLHIFAKPLEGAVADLLDLFSPSVAIHTSYTNAFITPSSS
ncbi:MAG: hypothetical protein ABWK05_05790 [Pyrobaculum sp.]